MKKIFSLLSMLFVCVATTQAQISEVGEPMSFSPYFEQVIDKNSPLLTTQIPSLDMAKVKKEVQEGIGVNATGRPIFVNFSLENAGRWDVLNNGDRVWRLKVKSEGALHLAALYDEFYIPQGAKLYVIDGKNQQYSGAYTSLNNHPSGEMATDAMNGYEMTLEYFEPKEVKGQGKIHIYRIEHGYRPIIKQQNESEKNTPQLHGFGDSNQSCQININCTLGNNWQTQKRSVAQMTMVFTGFSAVCTGALIQNDQGKNYILSAWHCQSGATPLYNQWNFGFGWEAASCSNPPSSPVRQSMIGCTEKVKSNSSDYLLLELNNAIPSNYNVYYAGWDRTGTNSPNATGIHHPAGDIKKISYVNATVAPNAASVTFGGGTDPLVIASGNLWGLIWTNGDTEGGSSGSPLFDNNKRVIGQLTGGSGDCTDTPRSYYGRMSSNWTGLQPFLSGTDADRMIMDGFDPNIASVNTGVTAITTTVSACNLGNNVPVKITIRNNGSTLQTNLPYSWTLAHTSGNQTGNGTIPSLAGLTTADVNISVNMPNTGTYTLTARTNTVGDLNAGDDARVVTFTNTTPTVSSSNVTFADVTDVFKTTINFTKGNGENRLVLVKEGNSFSPADLPVQGQSYSASFNFGSGAKVGDAYAVYRGAGSAAPIVDGLTVNATYHVAIIEYSCSPPKYLLGSGVTYSSQVYTATERNFLAEGIKVYPNPTETGKEIRVELTPTFTEGTTWQLQTLQGQTVQAGSFEKGAEGFTTIIQTQKQFAGMYLLRVQSGKGVAVKKIVVK